MPSWSGIEEYPPLDAADGKSEIEEALYPTARTPWSPTIPIQPPAARPEIPVQRPAHNWGVMKKKVKICRCQNDHVEIEEKRDFKCDTYVRHGCVYRIRVYSIIGWECYTFCKNDCYD